MSTNRKEKSGNSISPWTHTSKKGASLFIVPPCLGERDGGKHVLCHIEGGQITKMNKDNLRLIKRG